MPERGFSTRLEQGVRQEMQLLPRMLQAIEVLQLSSVELEGYLQEAIQENEALRLDGPEPLREPTPRSPSGDGEGTERHSAWLESLAEDSAGLSEHLLAQLSLLEIPAELHPWVTLVIRSLDPAGYLRVSDEKLLELAEEEGLEPERGTLGRAIAAVQALEPRGVGGRDAEETLLLQLDPGEPDYALLCRLVEEFLEDLARNKLPYVARKLGLDVERLNELLGRLRELRLAPGSAHAGKASPPVRPELIVERRAGGGFEVRLVDGILPPVTLDGDVQELARDKGQTPDLRRYLRKKIEKAHWLIDAVEQRARTLLRVARSIFEHQSAFLEHGPGHLVPLQMSDLAQELGVHVSTVSRAVAGKHAATPFGVQPLRRFFQSRAGGSESTSGGAREDVRDRVGRIIEAEDSTHPLSDDEIVQRLQGEGLKLARRTVAKYRKELGLPSSYRRRRYA